MNSANGDFVAFVSALEPYLSDLVVIGGWAHRLFRFHEWAQATAFEPLTTDDTDVLAPLRLKPRGKDLHALLTESGFDVQLSGETPPVTKYYRRGDSSAFHLEFVAERKGGRSRRDGGQNTSQEVLGVTVQKLAYVELLGWEPWTLEVDSAHGFPVKERAARVTVANPVPYLAQKALVFPRQDRARDKQAKDILYIHDTLLMMSARLGDLATAWGRLCQDTQPAWVVDLRKIRESEFSVATDRLRRAELIARASGRPNPPNAEQIRQVCRLGLKRVFGLRGEA